MIPSDDRARVGMFVVLTLGVLLIGTPLLSASAETITQSEWDQVALQTSPQSQGCFSMSYPSTTWSSVTCGHNDAPHATPLVGNNYGDDVANAVTASKVIGETQGSFASTTGFTSESDGNYSTNSYSLQLNTNNYHTSSTYWGSTSIVVWQQFVMQNYGGGNDTTIVIQYVLIDYYANNGQCPTIATPAGVSSWSNDGVSCYASDSPMSTHQEQPSRLADDYVTLEGLTGQSGNDVVKMCDYNLSKCWSESTVDFLNLGTNWSHSEFNIFGYGNGSRANFNTGMSTDVEIHVWDTSSNAITPSCVNTSYTAETSDMTLTSGSCTTGSGYTDFAESH
jgi:hypothetical protein